MLRRVRISCLFVIYFIIPSLLFSSSKCSQKAEISAAGRIYLSSPGKKHELLYRDFLTCSLLFLGKIIEGPKTLAGVPPPHPVFGDEDKSCPVGAAFVRNAWNDTPVGVTG